MDRSVSHERKDETIESKARWFQSLTVREREELLCQFTDMILSINPEIMEKKNSQPIAGRILVLTKK